MKWLFLFLFFSLAYALPSSPECSYDEEGRLIHFVQKRDGNVVQDIQKRFEAESEITTFANGAKCVCDTPGRRWFDKAGLLVYEETKEERDNQIVLKQRVPGKGLRRAEFSFAEDGKLKKVKSADGYVVTYTYGPNISSKESGACRKVFYEKDDQGRLIRAWSQDKTIDYAYLYDGEGRIVEIIDQINGTKIVRSYDDQGRLIVDGEEDRPCQISYAEDGSIASIAFSDGTIHHYSFSPEGKILVQGRAGAEFIEKIVSRDNQVILDPVQQAAGDGRNKYSFSPFGTLERVGRKKASHDAFGRVRSLGQVRCMYDRDGNLMCRKTKTKSIHFAYDALGRLKRAQNQEYRYDGFGRLQEIISKRGSKIVSKRLFWFGDLELGSEGEKKIVHPKTQSTIGCELSGKMFRVVKDVRGSILELVDPETKKTKEKFRYTLFGRPLTKSKSSCPWRYCGKRKLLCAYDFGARRYDFLGMRWFEPDPLGLVDGVDSRIFVHNNPALFKDPTGCFAIPLDSSVAGYFPALRYVTANAIKTITFAREKYDWLCDMRASFEDVMFSLVNKTWLRLIGYNPDASECLYYEGERELQHVRLTMINGILNGLDEAKKSAELLSHTHGGHRVHYVYSATGGFTDDFMRGLFSKFGLSSHQAKMLAILWKKLFDEMGEQGKIIHYAHSLGSTDTENALRFMTAQERERIFVSTFGASTLVQEGTCSRADNYVSYHDGVPALDMYRYFSGAVGWQNNVHFLPSENGWPLMDHLFGGSTYRKKIEELGKAFQREYNIPFMSP